MGELERGGEHHLEHPLPDLQGELLHGGDVLEAGVVHQDVHAHGRCLLAQGLHLFGVGEVRLEEDPGKLLGEPEASRTSWTKTLAPSRAKALAMARPMPLPAPVTRTVLPENAPIWASYRLRYASRTLGSWARAWAGPSRTTRPCSRT